jgi:hypothetical protein
MAAEPEDHPQPSSQVGDLQMEIVVPLVAEFRPPTVCRTASSLIDPSSGWLILMVIMSPLPLEGRCPAGATVGVTSTSWCAPGPKSLGKADPGSLDCCRFAICSPAVPS